VTATTTPNLYLATAIAVALVACGTDEDGTAGGKNTGDLAVDTRLAVSEPSVRTTAVPADPCGWIPVSEVEAVVGKLSGPPRPVDGCRYTLLMPQEAIAKRQMSSDQREQLRAQLKNFSLGSPNGVMADHDRDPGTYALTLKVDVSGAVAGELGAAAAGQVLQSWQPPQQRDGQNPSEEADKPDGWDAQLPVPYGFGGRIGHLHISVMGEAPDVPRDLAQALAARVRDRIPDLPFPATNPYQVLTKEQKQQPCGLLTRAKAEAVLGPLVVEPYRSSSYHLPLVHGDGHACAYFTSGHHVFVLSPTWSDAQQAFNIEKGLGGLASLVAPQDNVVLKGPWDQARVGAASGALQFLKGDRLLEVHYLTSSTDMRGAVKLAAQAMERM